MFFVQLSVRSSRIFFVWSRDVQMITATCERFSLTDGD